MRKPYGKVKNESFKRRQRRRLSTRAKISGTAERPRICAVRSNKNLTVQVIDDTAGKTLFSVQTFGKNAVEGGNNKKGAQMVGEKVAEQLKSNKIEAAVFDRAGYRFHGVVETIVNAVKESGVQV